MRYARFLLVVVAATAVLWLGGRDARAVNSITSPDTGGNVGVETSLVLDGSDNPVVSYYDVTNGYLKVLHCGDPNCSSGNSITSPDTAFGAGRFPSLVLDGSGNPVVSYKENGFGDDLKVLHCGDPNCSSGNVVTSPDTVGDVGRYSSIALDGSGNPVVSYYDDTNGDLKVLHCGDATCSSGNLITSPDTAGDVGRFTSMALDGSGNPVVSYRDESSFSLNVLTCGDATCSSGNVITAPDPGINEGFNTSLVLDGSGNPVVSYYDNSSGDLKVLTCGDATCSSGNLITSPDTVGDVGTWKSLVLDGTGNPVVSYWDVTNEDLKVLHCGDASCSSGNLIASPDTGGDVGAFSSLALDGSGNPVVSYYDGTNQDLKVLHCSDPYCEAPGAPTPTPTPVPPGSVGGIVEFRTDAAAPASEPGTPSGSDLPVTTSIVIAAVAFAGAVGGWCAWRQLVNGRVQR